MSDPTQRPGTAADFPAIAAFIVRMNQRPEQRCLHCGDSVEAVLKGLEDFGLSPERSIVLALSGPRIVGLVGADLATDLERGWLWGPFVDAADPLPRCDALLAHFLASIPDDIRMIDTFLAEGNLFLAHLARAHGFGSPRTVHLYRAERPASGSPPGPAPERILVDQADALTALHDVSFPNTWLTAAAMMAIGDASKALFVHADAGRLEGYVYVEADPIERTGHVHFLAVMPESRHRGVGRRLLSQALEWCFNDQGLPSASLTVLDTLVNARALYESAGFRLTDTGITQRRPCDPI